jgi:probable rRNA maturation factor
MLKVTTHSRVKLSPKSQRWLALAAEVASGDLPKTVREALLNVMICGDARMRSMNREHRGKDKTTDVLSFPAQLSLRKKADWDWIASGILPIGDLVISLPQARRQAKEFGVRLEEELVHLFFHGFLHLYGFDHEISAKEEKIMQQHEARLLEKFAKLRKKKGLK